MLAMATYVSPIDQGDAVIAGLRQGMNDDPATFDEATYAQSAKAWVNPDHVAIVVHNYRWRQQPAEGEHRYDALERELARRPVIEVPTITIASDLDGPNADGAGYHKQFSGPYEHRILTDIGHNVPQEAPDAFTRAVLDVSR